MSFLHRLSAFRAEEEGLRWEGTFTEYLEIVKDNPGVAKSAHARIYDMIASAGIDTDEQERRHYKFFEKEIFGLDSALERLVEEYFHAAARRLEVRKRILLLMGPVSGGKSTIVTMLKQGLQSHPGRSVVRHQGLPDARRPAALDSARVTIRI
jgi:serine protein kinase